MAGCAQMQAPVTGPRIAAPLLEQMLVVVLVEGLAQSSLDRRLL